MREQDNVCANSRCSDYLLDLLVADFDHCLPLWKGGDNSYSNYQALCKSCHAVKTRAEAGERAKWKRQINKHRGKPPTKKRGRPKMKMANRPFQKDLKRKLNGEVVKR